MEDWNKKLTTAAWEGDTEALKLSLQNGAEIDYQDVNGQTSLMIAAMEGYLEISRLLIDRGCNINITSVTGWTALMYAAMDGYLEISRLLIDRGCKIDITNNRGETALHWAAREGYLQITRCLVERGASPLVKSHKGETPYNLAATWKRGQYEEVMDYLQLTKISEKTQHVPGSHLWVENTSPIQSTSTKVRVSVKRGKRDYSNISEELPSKRNLREFTAEQINFTKMGIIVLNILADASYDLLKRDIPNLRPRNDCDITYLYQEHRKFQKHVPSKGWGGEWQKLQVTNIAVGDDIERIRLTRNELQHSRAAELGDTRFNELCNILSDLLKRFDQLNKPTRLYTDHLNKILAKTISAEDVQSIENEILEMDIEVELIPTQ